MPLITLRLTPIELQLLNEKVYFTRAPSRSAWIRDTLCTAFSNLKPNAAAALRQEQRARKPRRNAPSVPPHLQATKDQADTTSGETPAVATTAPPAPSPARRRPPGKPPRKPPLRKRPIGG